MNDEIVMKEIVDTFSFIQNYVKNHTEQSFGDISSSLENLFVELLNIVEGGDHWKNANAIKSNFPAIDLINEVSKTAIQITTNASKKKITDTIRIYNENSMAYDELIIIGFLKHIKYCENNVSAVGIKYLLNKVSGASLEVKQKVLSSLMNQIPLHKLYPLSDNNSFEVVLSVIDRSAVRDRHFQEGSYSDMVLGLKEIKEVITTGQIKGKNIHSKPLCAYGEPMQSELSEIEYQVSSIIRICNKAKRDEFVYLDYEDTQKIDEIKQDIIRKTNMMCKRLDIAKRVRM